MTTASVAVLSWTGRWTDAAAEIRRPAAPCNSAPVTGVAAAVREAYQVGPDGERVIAKTTRVGHRPGHRRGRSALCEPTTPPRRGVVRAAWAGAESSPLRRNGECVRPHRPSARSASTGWRLLIPNR